MFTRKCHKIPKNKKVGHKLLVLFQKTDVARALQCTAGLVIKENKKNSHIKESIKTQHPYRGLGLHRK